MSATTTATGIPPTPTQQARNFALTEKGLRALGRIPKGEYINVPKSWFGRVDGRWVLRV